MANKYIILEFFLYADSEYTVKEFLYKISRPMRELLIENLKILANIFMASKPVYCHFCFLNIIDAEYFPCSVVYLPLSPTDTLSY